MISKPQEIRLHILIVYIRTEILSLQFFTVYNKQDKTETLKY